MSELEILDTQSKLESNRVLPGDIQYGVLQVRGIRKDTPNPILVPADGSSVSVVQDVMLCLGVNVTYKGPASGGVLRAYEGEIRLSADTVNDMDIDVHKLESMVRERMHIDLCEIVDGDFQPWGEGVWQKGPGQLPRIGRVRYVWFEDGVQELAHEAAYTS